MDLSAGQPALAFSPHPLLLARERELVYAHFLANETILEYLRRTGLAERMGRQPFVLTLDGRRLPRAFWARAKPKPGSLINLYAVVQGGDGKKNPLATVAMIALIYFSGGTASGGWASTLAGAGASAGTVALYHAGIMVIGGLIVNSLFPPPRPDLARAQDLGGGDSPNYSIAGGSNRMRRYEPMAKIVGVHRVFPDFGAQPYSEFQGNDQVVYYVLDFGYNDCELSDLKIGDTPIEEFEGVEMETSVADGKLTLFPGNVDTVAGVELTEALGFVSRNSSPAARSLAVELNGALFYLGDSGTEPRQATVDIQYRLVGAGAWTGLTFQSDAAPSTSIVNGVARVPASQYAHGVRREITGQPKDLTSGTPIWTSWCTVLSASGNAAAGDYMLVLGSAGMRWQEKAGGVGFFTGAFVPISSLQKGGMFLLYNGDRTQSLLVETAPFAVSFFPVGDEATQASITVGPNLLAGQFMLINATRDALRRTFKWNVAEGQYEVQVKKSTPDETNLRATAQLVWSALRTYQPDDADYSGRLRVGMKVRASALANGVLQQLSQIVRARTTVFGGGYDLQYDGIDDRVTLGATNVPASFSIETWFTKNAYGAQKSFFSNRGAGGVVYSGVKTKPFLVIDTATPSSFDGNTIFAASVRYHVAYTHDQATGLTSCYVNGVLDKSATQTGYAGSVGATGGIGWDPSIGTEFWDGKIDAVRTYSRALSAQEVADHSRGRFDDETGLVGRWEFDEGMGTVANDTSGNGNHGTLVNGPTWVAGDPDVPRANVQTSNPAWWYLDALRGKTIDGRRVYGAGLADARIDIEGLKAFAAWCTDQGLEFNGIFDQQTSLFELLSAIALQGRGTPTMQTGKHGVLWDAPALPVTALFGMHNIVAGSFSIDYATGDLADVIEVWFINPDLNWQRDFVRALVPGATSQARVRRVEAFGCTDKAQAGEVANLYAAQQVYRARRYKWRSDWEQMPCPRGDVAMIGHDLLQLRSGRFIEGGNTTTLKLPRTVPLYVAGGFITIRKPDGTFATYAVNGGAGDTDTLTLPAPLPFNPWADADGYPPYDYRWHYGPASDTGRKVKIDSFKPASLRYVDVTAVDEDPAYYASKDNALEALPAPGTFGQVQLAALNVTEDGVRAGTGYLAKVLVSWDATGDYGFADVRASVAGGPMELLQAGVRGRSFSFNVQDFADVIVEVTAWSSFGRFGKSSRLSVEHHVDYAGQSRPSDVGSFLLDGDKFRWLAVPEVDVVGYRIRYHFGENLSSADAHELHQGLLSASPAQFDVLPTGVVTFFLTAVDAAGLESVTPAIIVKDLGDPEISNIVEEKDFDAESYPGTLTGGTLSGGDLLADGTTAFYGSDSAAFYGADAGAFYEDEVYESMVYESIAFYFSNDWIGSAMTLEHVLEGEGLNIEYRQTNSESFYGADADPFYGADADPFYGEAGDYRAWPGTVTFDGGDYQLRITTAAGPVQGAVRELRVAIDVPDVSEDLNDIAIPPGGARLPIVKVYDLIKTVQLTLQDDDGAAVSARILDKDPALGPLVECIDETQASVAGLIDATITGR